VDTATAEASLAMTAEAVARWAEMAVMTEAVVRCTAKMADRPAVAIDRWMRARRLGTS
jgi:hypothetical protein